MTAARRQSGKDERGFALIAVLLILAMVGVLGTEFAYSMRLEASAARAYKETVIAGHLAEAAVQQAMREIVSDQAYVTLDDDGLLTFYTLDRQPRKRLPRQKVPLGAGHFSYRLTDESARINVNSAPAARLDLLLRTLGVDKIERDVIVDSIQDWRDTNEEHRLNGAESDYYTKLPVPYRAHNGSLESIAELLQVKGVTPALFNGTPERPGLSDLLTVRARSININTASKTVLTALGLSEAEIVEIEATRRETPYFQVPPRFTRPGLEATSRTFRIEGEGLVGGQARARLTAVVEVRADSGSPAVSILSWSGIR